MAQQAAAGQGDEGRDGRTGGGEAPPPVTLIVDGANVMGSRADGWWRDRAGAMKRLHGELTVLAARGIPGLPPGEGGGAVPEEAAGIAPGKAAERDVRWFPDVILVVEGKARAGLGQAGEDRRVRVVAARGVGDDDIAELAGRLPGQRIVVTADQELRRRCLAKGAQVAGPRWLTRLLE